MREMLTCACTHIQGFLFSMPREVVGQLTQRHERFAIVLDGAHRGLWAGVAWVAGAAADGGSVLASQFAFSHARAWPFKIELASGAGHAGTLAARPAFAS
jgi:hypothetical protein